MKNLFLLLGILFIVTVGAEESDLEKSRRIMAEIKAAREAKQVKPVAKTPQAVPGLAEINDQIEALEAELKEKEKALAQLKKQKKEIGEKALYEECLVEFPKFRTLEFIESLKPGAKSIYYGQCVQQEIARLERFINAKYAKGKEHVQRERIAYAWRQLRYSWILICKNEK